MRGCWFRGKMHKLTTLRVKLRYSTWKVLGSFLGMIKVFARTINNELPFYCKNWQYKGIWNKLCHSTIVTFVSMEFNIITHSSPSSAPLCVKISDSWCLATSFEIIMALPLRCFFVNIFSSYHEVVASCISSANREMTRVSINFAGLTYWSKVIYCFVVFYFLDNIVLYFCDSCVYNQHQIGIVVRSYDVLAWCQTSLGTHLGGG